MNVSAFNSIFGFPPIMDLDHHHVPKEFNPNVFWYLINKNYQYNITNSKGTITRNPCIRVAQCLLECGLFPREDSLNVPCLSTLYFLHSILQGDRIDPRSFFSN